MGRILVYVYEIIKFIFNEKLIMCMVDGFFLMEMIYIWIVIDDNRIKMIF